MAIIEPRVEEVNPQTRKCTGRLRAFRFDPEASAGGGIFRWSPSQGKRRQSSCASPVDFG